MSPLPVPAVDTRSYQELVDEALARIPVHNPEWTNFNRSDPGVTLIELFAFLTESLIYRANQIPERNRRKFLSLLGVPLKPASSARGIVTLTNERGPDRPITLARGLELRAGEVPFRTERGLDVLPLESRVYYKRTLRVQPDELVELYRQLYASYTEGDEAPEELRLYETVPFTVEGGPVDLAADTPDRSLWIALMLRQRDDSPDTDERDRIKQAMRVKLAGRTLSLGLVPVRDEPAARLGPEAEIPRSGEPGEVEPPLEVLLPAVLTSGTLGGTARQRVPAYRTLDASADVDVGEQPGILQVSLPEDPDELRIWEDLDPLESGVGEFPPSLEDTRLEQRLLTWLRVRARTGARARLLWAGIDATTVSQRAEVAGEVLLDGNGEPDQVARLANAPVIPDSVRLTVSIGDRQERWGRVEDLRSAPPEVPVPDLRLPPGAEGATSPAAAPELVNVFTVDAESAEIRFGDGFHGRRAPRDARLRADYAFAHGGAGNVGAGAIDTAPALLPGITVANPVRTWGGAEAQSAADGEKQITDFLRHRDRLVTTDDFAAIARRAPADIGRIEVLPAFSPELAPNAPGDAAGAVTLLVIPRYDAARPEAPIPDQAFLDAICSYLDSRRLVTTEIFLRGPTYKPVFVSVGLDAFASESFAEVRERVQAALTALLSPLPASARAGGGRESRHAETGWPLAMDVLALELQAVVSGVEGVRLVRQLLLAGGTGSAGDVPIAGLELPYLAGVVVSPGDALPLDQLRGLRPAAARTPPNVVPVPVVPETC